MAAARHSYKARGIVLHALKYGEGALIVHVLTDTHGRLSYIVQGLGRGKKQALYQPLFPLEFEGTTSSRQELHRLREVRLAYTPARTPFDVRRSTIALFMAECLYRLVRQSERDAALFDFVWECVSALDTLEEGVANFHLWFLAHLSRFLGFAPAEEWMPGAWFDAREGSFTLLKPLGPALTPPIAALLHRLLECSPAQLGVLELSREQRRELLDGLLRYYGYHLDIAAVQSLRVLREVF